MIEGHKEQIQEILDTVLKELTDAPYSMEVTEEREGVTAFEVLIEGENLGYMIGNRGFHLRGLQYVLSMMVNRKLSTDDHRYILNIDVGGYKRERRERVEGIAMRVVEDVRILGGSIDLEPMNSADRRYVHMLVSEMEGISSESHGEGNERYVTISSDMAPATQESVNGDSGAQSAPADLDMLDDDTEGLVEREDSEE